MAPARKAAQELRRGQGVCGGRRSRAPVQANLGLICAAQGPAEWIAHTPSSQGLSLICQSHPLLMKV